DGKETGSYWYAGRRDMGPVPTPLQIGNMGGYTFTGRLFAVRLDPLAAVTLPPGGPKPISFQPPKEQARASVKWVKPICVEKDRYIGWPSVCRLANGDVMAVFSGDRDSHICPWGKVQMVRSTDDGETWSAPATIANGPIDDRDAGVVQLPDGEILVTYFTSIAYRAPGILTKHPEYKRHDEKISDEVRNASLGNWAVRSRDNGKTWSKPEKLALKGQTPHGPILLKDGSLFQIGRSFTNARIGTSEKGRTLISAERSTDGGRTWQMLCPEIPDMNGENAKPHMFHEPHAVELADGTLVGQIRYHGPDNCMRQTVSRDGGKTWTPMAKTPMLGLPPHLIRLADGKLVTVYGRRFSDPGFGEFAMISDDGGATWDSANEISLAPSHSGDLGYPASCLLANGDILTVYYQQPALGQKPCLMATRWRVK
ncbi:MAG: exo-alpha-sialidase, partial [Kiritimatiellae bacterium]|nr:exo-alpha-sialidase [Kiritimatiellia bacterium]